MTSSRMPALFLGHGSPMNVLEDNVYTRAWRIWKRCRVRKRLWWSLRTGSPVARA
jgi:aromatic ring-opening dioxygenase catalytic subunit (LigB family)